MPYVRRKKTYAKKSYKKRPRKAFANSSDNTPKNLVNMGLGFPKMLLVKQKYVGHHNMVSNIGGLSRQDYRLNSVYDPDLTGVGHKAMFFNEYMSVYNHFHVIGAKVKVRFMSIEANTVPMFIGIMQNDDNTMTHVDTDTVGEQSKSRLTILGSAGSNVKELNFNWSAKKTFGAGVLSNNNLTGFIGANPAEQTIMNIVVQSADYVSTTSCIVQVYIEYLTIYSELKDLDGS